MLREHEKTMKINFTERAVSKLKKWFKNKRIREKINIIYILLIIGQLVVLSLAANYVFVRMIVSDVVRHSEEISRLVMLNIQEIIDNIESYSNDLTVRINNYFVDDRSDAYDDYNSNSILIKIFRNALYVYPRIYTATFILPDGRVFASDNATVSSEWYSTKKYLNGNVNENKGNLWNGMEKDPFITDNNDSFILTLGKNVININTGELEGYLLITTKETTFSSIYEGTGLGKTGRYFICDNQGIVVSSANKNEILKPIGNAELLKQVLDNKNRKSIIHVDGRKMVLVTYALPKLNWQLVGVVPLSELTEESTKMSIIIIIVGFICMITAVFLSNILSSTITKPLNKLMTEVGELELYNLNAITQVDAKDDIGLLADSFNVMKRRIGDLMSNVILQQEKQRKYELKLLQEQIKPHFLYNSLQLIYSMIEMDKKEQAMKATKSLADFYRIALSSGSEIISIAQEIKNVEDYLFIQRMRYDRVFDYHITIPREFEKYKILKLTLQPIVENCIRHGFESKQRDADKHILIKAERIHDVICIEITDNGIGIKPEKIQQLFDMENMNRMDSFGLKNIDERIKLFYGENYGIHIKSEYLKGTSVFVHIPALDDTPDNNL